MRPTVGRLVDADLSNKGELVQGWGTEGKLELWRLDLQQCRVCEFDALSFFGSL